MRKLTLLAVALGALALPAATSAYTPTSSYVWAQPGLALVACPDCQPPATIPTADIIMAFHASTGYVWAQPGLASVTIPYAQPPVSVPIG